MKIALCLAVAGILIFATAEQAHAWKMCPDGSYVGGDRCNMTPDGNYVGGDSWEMAPDGNYVGYHTVIATGTGGTDQTTGGIDISPPSRS